MEIQVLAWDKCTYVVRPVIDEKIRPQCEYFVWASLLTRGRFLKKTREFVVLNI
jgi:hypothetical protein